LCAAAQASPPATAAAPLSDAPTAALMSWARSNGIRAPLLTPASFGGLRGMAAVGDISAGSAVASVPHAAVLETTSVSRVCPHRGVCPPRAWAALPWWGRLAMLLLRESQLGAASSFAPYMAVLPRAFDTPLHWSAPQRDALAAPRLAARVEAQRRELREAHAAMAAVAAADEPASLAASVSLERFTWATEAVRSRTFSGPYEGSDAAERQQQLILIAGALRGARVVTRATHPRNRGFLRARALSRWRHAPPFLSIFDPSRLGGHLPGHGRGARRKRPLGRLIRAGVHFHQRPSDPRPAQRAQALRVVPTGGPVQPLLRRRVRAGVRVLPKQARCAQGKSGSGSGSTRGGLFAQRPSVHCTDARVRLLSGARSFSLLTGDFKRGEQVLISYGPQDNDELLQYYGFVEADNPNDGVPLGAQVLAAATAPAARLAALRASGGLAELEQVRAKGGGCKGGREGGGMRAFNYSPK
jgi:hypothetical protein